MRPLASQRAARTHRSHTHNSHTQLANSARTHSSHTHTARTLSSLHHITLVTHSRARGGVDHSRQYSPPVHPNLHPTPTPPAIPWAIAAPTVSTHSFRLICPSRARLLCLDALCPCRLLVPTHSTRVHWGLRRAILLSRAQALHLNHVEATHSPHIRLLCPSSVCHCPGLP